MCWTFRVVCWSSYESKNSLVHKNFYKERISVHASKHISRSPGLVQSPCSCVALWCPKVCYLFKQPGRYTAVFVAAEAAGFIQSLYSAAERGSGQTYYHYNHRSSHSITHIYTCLQLLYSRIIIVNPERDKAESKQDSKQHIPCSVLVHHILSMQPYTKANNEFIARRRKKLIWLLQPL